MTATPPIDLLLLRREASLLRREQELRRENGILFYQPHEKQTLFHSQASFHYRYARTGNRFGKSEMGAAEDVAFALGYRPWLPQGDPLRTLGIPSHPTKGLIITTDWDKSKEVFTEQEGEIKGKLFKYIPANALGQPTRNHSGAIDRIPVRHISGGWSIIHLDTVKSYKQNPLGQESSAWDWVHVDEPIPEGMWKAVARGLVDRGGRAWFTCTPLTEPWLDEAFVPAGGDRVESVTFSSADRFMMTGTMWDNPYNKKADIDSFLSWLTEDEKSCRINGLPTSFAGLIFKEFSWNLHVSNTPPTGWSDWHTPPDSCCRRFAIDYHFRKNDAVLFVATDQMDISYVYAEIWEQMLLDEQVRRINSIHGKHIPIPGLVDPLASTPNKVTEVTAMDEYRRLGLPVMPATKDPVNGIRKVKETLKARTRRGGPVLLFNPACTRTLFEISRGFVWDGDENKPQKKNDDMMENLHRLILQGLDYIEPTLDLDYGLPPPYTDLPDNVLDFEPFENAEDAERRERQRRHKARYAS